MGAIVLRGGKARRVGSEGALDECGKHLDCGGVIPGGLEVQGLGKGSSFLPFHNPVLLECCAQNRRLLSWREAIWRSQRTSTLQ